MKIIVKAILLSILVITLVSCNTYVPEPTATPMPTSASSTITPEATSTFAETADLPPTSTATEIPVDIHAPYNEAAVPTEDIANAFAQAENDGKLILLDFGANWCLDCVVLTVLFEDPAVKPYLEENYHVVRIDVGEWDKNLDVAQEYGNPIEYGIPAVVVLTPSGEIIATTKDGSLANARTATASEVLALLKDWVAQKP